MAFNQERSDDDDLLDLQQEQDPFFSSLGLEVQDTSAFPQNEDQFEETDPASALGHNSAILLPASPLPPPVVDPGHSHPRRLHNTRHSRGCSRGRSRGRGHTGSRSRSNRHRSSGRRSARSSRSYFKHSERNFAAASCSMVAIVLLCISLEPNWIRMKGGDCHLLHTSKGSLHSLSTRQFFYNGHFYKNYPSTEKGDQVYKFGDGANELMVNCVTYSAVLLFKASIAFTLLAVIFSFLAFLLDIFGPSNQLLKMLRRNAIFNILTVIMTVTVNLFAFWITTSVQRLQLGGRLHPGSHVEVTFDVSFYLLAAAGGVSVLATACNCLKRPRTGYPRRPVENSYDAYFDDCEALLPPIPPEEPMDNMANLPPPPPYTP